MASLPRSKEEELTILRVFLRLRRKHPPRSPQAKTYRESACAQIRQLRLGYAEYHRPLRSVGV